MGSSGYLIMANFLEKRWIQSFAFQERIFSAQVRKQRKIFTSIWTLDLGFFPIILNFQDVWINKADLQVVLYPQLPKNFLLVGKSEVTKDNKEMLNELQRGRSLINLQDVSSPTWMQFSFYHFFFNSHFFLAFERKWWPRVANGLQEKGMKMAQKIWIMPLSATMKEWDMQRWLIFN